MSAADITVSFPWDIQKDISIACVFILKAVKVIVGVALMLAYLAKNMLTYVGLKLLLACR